MPVTATLQMGAASGAATYNKTTPEVIQIVDAVLEHQEGIDPAGLTNDQKVEAFLKAMLKWASARASELTRNAAIQATVGSTPDIGDPT